MREIEYRGKRVDNGEWVYGSYLRLNTGNNFICEGQIWINSLQPCKTQIYLETLGQYTGLKDKNKTKIYESDIIWDEELAKSFVITWDKFWGWIISDEEQLGDINFAHIEVIGNIHDNKELLIEDKLL